jgi:hypothetical protein
LVRSEDPSRSRTSQQFNTTHTNRKPLFAAPVDSKATSRQTPRMANLFSMILGMTPRQCPSCGAANFKRSTHCAGCGDRIRNRNPILRFIITIIALGIVGLILWWQMSKGGAR